MPIKTPSISTVDQTGSVRVVDELADVEAVVDWLVDAEVVLASERYSSAPISGGELLRPPSTSVTTETIDIPAPIKADPPTRCRSSDPGTTLIKVSVEYGIFCRDAVNASTFDVASWSP